jgi:vacuolar-type H+-ATPase subunit I/STV1
MTREEAKAKLVSYGAVEPTDEQISDLLNSIQTETKAEHTKAEKYKTDAEKYKAVQTELDTLKSQGLSDVEKASQELEKANARIAELEKSSTLSEIKAILNTGKLKEEDYKDFVDGFVVPGDLEASKARANAFVGAFSKNIESAIKQNNKDLLDGTKTPGGDEGDETNKLTEAEQIAKDLGKQSGVQSKSASDIIGNYI